MIHWWLTLSLILNVILGFSTWLYRNCFAILRDDAVRRARMKWEEENARDDPYQYPIGDDPHGVRPGSLGRGEVRRP